MRSRELEETEKKRQPQTDLKRVLLLRDLVVALHDLPIDAETQHVITDLVIVRDRRDFRRQSAIQRVLHGFSSARRFRRLIVVPSDHLCHHYRRCRRAFTSALLLLVLLENGPLGRPAKQQFAFEIRGIEFRARARGATEKYNVPDCNSDNGVIISLSR